MLLTKTQTHTFDDEKKRQVLTEAFFNLTQKWDLTREEEAGLLGWTYQEKRTKLDNLRKGKSILSQDRDKVERILDLINIHKSLRILFPNDRHCVYQWIKLPRKRFGNHTALEIMLNEGKEGITAIRRYLDYERTR